MPARAVACTRAVKLDQGDVVGMSCRRRGDVMSVFFLCRTSEAPDSEIFEGEGASGIWNILL